MLPVAQTWLVQLADALHFLHSQRVLHRDLKPANIFVKRGGHGIVKLGDFGLARALSSQTKMANSVVGTPYYLSPGLFSSPPPPAPTHMRPSIAIPRRQRRVLSIGIGSVCT